MLFSSSSTIDARFDPVAPEFHPLVGSVHVWWADLAQPEPEIARFHELISPAERDRATRFRNADSRRRFVVARGVLRTLLGRYLAEDPTDVALTVGSFGKPRLAEERTALRFNLSHAGDLAVYAFADECEVGIDLELIQEVAEWQAISASFFEDGDKASLAALADSQQSAAFIGAWARHEAFLKATGSGWIGPRPAAFASFAFSFCPIEPPAGFAAALAIEGPPAAVMDAGYV